MSKLMDYGPGEITDRLTILALKILYGQARGVDVAHWVTERSKLLVAIRSRTLNSHWFEQVLDLAAVNAALWHAEDAMRAWRAATNPAEPDEKGDLRLIADLAFRVQALNDQRASLVAAINKAAGEPVNKEKLGLPK